MGSPLHQQIGSNVARQVIHLPLLELSGGVCCRQVKPPVDVLPADATHIILYGDVKSCLLPASDARWLWWRCHVYHVVVRLKVVQQ